MHRTLYFRQNDYRSYTRAMKSLVAFVLMWIFGLGSFGLLRIDYVMALTESAEQPAIAVVRGVTVTRSEIFAPKHEDRVRILRQRINDILLIQESKRRGVFVTDSEADGETQRLLKEAGVTAESIAKFAREKSLLIDALEENMREPSTGARIYREKLSEQISPAEWEEMKSLISTQRQIDEMRQRMPSNIEDVVRETRPSTRATLIEKKLRDKVAGKEIATEAEIAEAIKRLPESEPAKPVETVRKAVEQRKQDEKWRNFRLEMWRAGEIKIIDKKFNDAALFQ